MKAVILAAGEGKRMRPLTETTPKPMLEILGKPILEHIFDSLPDAVDEVVLGIGYLGDQIKTHFGSSFGGRAIRYVERMKPLGTAYGLWMCRDLLGDERFLMMYADDLQSKRDIERCIAFPLAMLVKKVEDPRRFGVVVVDSHWRVTDLVEKPEVPPSSFASTGVKVLDGRIFNYPAPQRENGEYYITDSLRALARDHTLVAVEASFWLPIGDPEDLARVGRILNDRGRV